MSLSAEFNEQQPFVCWEVGPSARYDTSSHVKALKRAASAEWDARRKAVLHQAGVSSVIIGNAPTELEKAFAAEERLVFGLAVRRTPDVPSVGQSQLIKEIRLSLAQQHEELRANMRVLGRGFEVDPELAALHMGKVLIPPPEWTNYENLWVPAAGFYAGPSTASS